MIALLLALVLIGAHHKSKIVYGTPEHPFFRLRSSSEIPKPAWRRHHVIPKNKEKK
jgi:hypothetical protein